VEGLAGSGQWAAGSGAGPAAGSSANCQLPTANSYDVAIIGAGPAGSTLAALLARRGVAVLLIDREEFPRDKLCGEFLSYDALPVLEPLGIVDAIDVRGAPRIEHCRVVGRRRTYEFDFPHAARGVSRFYFDDLLRRTAIANGAQFRVEPAILPAPAKVTAGAWGRWGRYDQQLGRAFVTDKKHRNFGFKRHYRGAVDSTIEIGRAHV